MRMHVPYLLALGIGFAATLPARAADLPPSEFRARRAEAMRRMPDGILLLPSATFDVRLGPALPARVPAAPELLLLHGAVQRLGRRPRDRRRRRRRAGSSSRRSCRGFSARCSSGRRIEPGPKTAASLGLDRVVDRKELPAFLTRRQDAPGLLLYTAGLADAHGFPLDIALDDPQAAWNHALAELWPTEPSAIRRPDPRADASRQEPGRDRGAAPRRKNQRDGAPRGARGPASRALPARGGRRRGLRLPRRRRGGTVVLAVGDDGPGERLPGALRVPRRLPPPQPRHARRRGRAGGRGLRRGPLQGRRRPHRSRLRPLRRGTAGDVGAV